MIDTITYNDMLFEGRLLFQEFINTPEILQSSIIGVAILGIVFYVGDKFFTKSKI